MRSLFAIVALLVSTSGTLRATIIVAPTVGGSSAGSAGSTSGNSNNNSGSSGGSSGSSSSNTGSTGGTVTAVKAGLHIEQRVSRHLFISPGLFYSVYGFAALVSGIHTQYRYNTAEIPLYLLLKTGMPCRPRLVLGAGIVGMVPMKNVMSVEGGTAPFSSDKGLKPGAGVSLGLEFPRGLFLSAAYQTIKMPNAGGAQGIQQKLYQYSLGMGYLIGKVQTGGRRQRYRRNDQ